MIVRTNQNAQPGESAVSDQEPKAERPATFGGLGWSVRVDSHEVDVGGGKIWPKCGLNSEWAPLRSVLLSWPSSSFTKPGNANENLMLSWPQYEVLEQQCRATEAFFASKGIAVHLHRPHVPPPPNYLFMRDLVFMTPQGAILARPASPVRAPEAQFAQAALANAGVPILAMIRGNATLEGADCLWTSPKSVLIGTGTRTNDDGVSAMKRLLLDMDVQVHTAALPAGVQHLLGVVLIVDCDLAVVDAERVTPSIKSALADQGISTLDVPTSRESRDRRAMNGVVLGPREVVIPAGCPMVTKQMETAGIKVHHIDVSEYIQAAGALGCMTAILHRDLVG